MPIEYVLELKAEGIEDSIVFYKEKFIKLNQEANVAKNVKKQSRFLVIHRKNSSVISL